MAEMAVVVTVAAMFMVPSARRNHRWPAGGLGSALDGALLAALGVMTAWAAWSFAT